MVCDIFCVTKLFKMVFDKVVRDKDVCERWCVTNFVVTKLLKMVCDKV